MANISPSSVWKTAMGGSASTRRASPGGSSDSGQISSILGLSFAGDEAYRETGFVLCNSVGRVTAPVKRCDRLFQSLLQTQNRPGPGCPGAERPRPTIYLAALTLSGAFRRRCA